MISSQSPRLRLPRAGPKREQDFMLGCPKCRWLKNGCGACRERPMLARPRQRWQPENGRYQHASVATLCALLARTTSTSGPALDC